MSVYPVFTYEKINERYHKDIRQFLMPKENETDHEKNVREKMVKFMDRQNIEIPKDIENENDLRTRLSEIKRIFGVDFGQKTYVEQIHSDHPDLETLSKLWLYRTYLFYQMIDFARLTFSKSHLYNRVFSGKYFLYPYRPDIVNELEHFKLAIFGSITPTSDIDVGVHYLGEKLEKPGLAYVVSGIESLFLIFTNRSTLDFDIELYSDILTLPIPGDPNNDYFYLDTTKFTHKDFEKMLDIAGNSIARNVYLKDPDNFKSVKLSSIRDTISRIDGILDLDEIIEKLNEQIWNGAKQRISKFFSMSYDDQRRTYYRKVNKAETYIYENIRSRGLNISHDVICQAMYLIGDSLTYRMESYNCVPTVMHVVRILQAKKTDLTKYETCTPAVCCGDKIQYNTEPYCSIGPYGYLLSALEQIGYLYRFESRKPKYIERYQNAIRFYQKQKSRSLWEKPFSWNSRKKTPTGGRRSKRVKRVKRAKQKTNKNMNKI